MPDRLDCRLIQKVSLRNYKYPHKVNIFPSKLHAIQLGVNFEVGTPRLV